MYFSKQQSHSVIFNFSLKSIFIYWPNDIYFCSWLYYYVINYNGIPAIILLQVEIFEVIWVMKWQSIMILKTQHEYLFNISYTFRKDVFVKECSDHIYYFSGREISYMAIWRWNALITLLKVNRHCWWVHYFQLCQKMGRAIIRTHVLIMEKVNADK